RAPDHLAPLAARTEILIDRARAPDARKLLEDWRGRHAARARDPDLLRLLDRARLASGLPRQPETATSSLGQWPAPAFQPLQAASGAMPGAAGNGVVIDGGARVLTLRSIAARGKGRFLVRNARGEVRSAVRVAAAAGAELASLQLEQPYPR